MKGKDLIQTDKDKRPLLVPKGVKVGCGSEYLEIVKKLVELKTKRYSNFWYKKDKNVIIDKYGFIVKFCDVRRGKLYMLWQRIKYKVFNKL